MADYESVLCVKNEIFVYQIPARQSNRGYRAADWKLEEPDWTGRLKVVAKGRNLAIRLEDKNSGELFAMCPVEAYPTPVIEQVLDSSRYFVIRIQDGNNRHAFIGIGFADRSDSFDLLVAIQDHFKYVKREDAQGPTDDKQLALDAQPKLDLGFKEGQTIKINIATKKSGDAGSSGKSKPRTAGMSGGLIPPPPGGAKILSPPTSSGVVAPPARPMGTVAAQPISNLPMFDTRPVPQSKGPSSNMDMLLDLGASSIPLPAAQSSSGPAAEEWDSLSGAMSSKLTVQPQPAAVGKTAGISWENFE